MAFHTILWCLALCLATWYHNTLSAPMNYANEAPVINEEVAQEFLTRYSYVKKPPKGAPAQMLDRRDLQNALLKFQRMAHIPTTGVLDNDTKAMMQKPRCGLPDIHTNDNPFSRSKRYSIEKPWAKNHLTYKITHYHRDLTNREIEIYLQRAFDAWAALTPLTFTRKYSGDVDITVFFAAPRHDCVSDFDYAVLAHAFFPANGDIHFNNYYNWTTDETEAKLNVSKSFYKVALHEIGHSLGLSHSSYKKVVMSPYYGDLQSALMKDDIDGVQYLYGGPKPGDRIPAGPKPHDKVPAGPKPDDRIPAGPKPDDRIPAGPKPDDRIPAGPNPRDPKVEPDEHSLCHFPAYDAFTRSDDDKHYAFAGNICSQLFLKGRRSIKAFNVRERWHNFRGKIDAALWMPLGYKYIATRGDYDTIYAHTLFFQRSRVWKYIGNQYQSGFPKIIGELFNGLPDSIDSAFHVPRDDTVYFTKGPMYYRYSTPPKMDPGFPRRLSTDFRGLPNTVDAAFNYYHGEILYFFKGKLCYKYDMTRKRVADGYPRLTNDEWFYCKSAAFPAQQLRLNGSDATTPTVGTIRTTLPAQMSTSDQSVLIRPSFGRNALVALVFTLYAGTTC